MSQATGGTRNGCKIGEWAEENNNMAVNKGKLDVGSVAILDAMGFKGIWKRHRVNAILAKLERLVKIAGKLEEFWGDTKHIEGQTLTDDGTYKPMTFVLEQPNLSIKFMSDTIVIGSVAKSTDDEDMAGSLWNVARMCALVAYLGRRPPASRLLYRGTIASGKFLMSENFLIGEAIDEAAELFELSQIPCTWLAPSAVCVLDEQGHSTPGVAEPISHSILWYNQLINNVPVPVKGGSSCDTWCVQPYHGLFRSGRKEILNAFGRRPLAFEIDLKRQATEQWLIQCEMRIRELCKGEIEDTKKFDGWTNIWLNQVVEERMTKGGKKRKVRV